MMLRTASCFLLLCFIWTASPAPPVDRGNWENDNVPVKVRVSVENETVDVDGDVANAKLEDLKREMGRPVALRKKQPNLVRRPDHLDAVPLERDGHLNKQFRQEILFGETENGKKSGRNGNDTADKVKYDEKMSNEEKEMLLIETFHKADKDTDGYLTGAELEQWIQETTLRHLDEAVKETRVVMDVMDENGDGFATWDEYHFHFLVDNRLMEPEKARQHDENHADLSPDDQEKIETEIEEWHEADRDPKDGQLSLQEFLAFRHPEHSEVMLNEMVKDIMRSLDSDNDGRLSEDEFVAVPKGELVDKQWEEAEKEYLGERRKEFKELIDLNQDGYVNFKELVEYTNPRNIQHAKREVRDLMEVGDSNRDGKLSLNEVLQQKAVFLGSRLINIEKTMHDEF